MGYLIPIYAVNSGCIVGVLHYGTSQQKQKTYMLCVQDFLPKLFVQYHHRFLLKLKKGETKNKLSWELDIHHCIGLLFCLKSIFNSESGFSQYRHRSLLKEKKPKKNRQIKNKLSSETGDSPLYHSFILLKNNIFNIESGFSLYREVLRFQLMPS